MVRVVLVVTGQSAHGRPLYCLARHGEQDTQLGRSLCWCYDYPSHVLWQWHAPELWRRFTITLARALAARCGLTPAPFRRRARVAYTKVVEFQARGIIHVHAPSRLDGPHGPDTPPPFEIDAHDSARPSRAAHNVQGHPREARRAVHRLRPRRGLTGRFRRRRRAGADRARRFGLRRAGLAAARRGRGRPREPVPGRVAASRPPATSRRRHLDALAEAGIDPSPQVIAGLATGVDPGPLPASP
jgi:hypothetical protein